MESFLVTVFEASPPRRNWRLRFLLLQDNKCPRPALALLILPVAVFLNRLASAFLVFNFCFAITPIFLNCRPHKSDLDNNNV
ncbi:MAG: hypothetical protein A2X46_04160 [Lentisphaerae bacterium GWF2_57_35]|nr:MAG: hypothetical protein A2X46_04160 [Lentisphaerae bacterium GWF2_57_35]